MLVGQLGRCRCELRLPQGPNKQLRDGNEQYLARGAGMAAGGALTAQRTSSPYKVQLLLCDSQLCLELLSPCFSLDIPVPRSATAVLQ